LHQRMPGNPGVCSRTRECSSKFSDGTIGHRQGPQPVSRCRCAGRWRNTDCISNEPRPTGVDHYFRESSKPVGDFFQPLDMRNVSARFDRVQEVSRRAVVPCLDRLRFRQMIESVVDFNGIEMPGVVVKPLGFPQALRVEESSPVVVIPPRCIDSYLFLRT